MIFSLSIHIGTNKFQLYSQINVNHQPFLSLISSIGMKGIGDHHKEMNACHFEKQFQRILTLFCKNLL